MGAGCTRAPAGLLICCYGAGSHLLGPRARGSPPARQDRAPSPWETEAHGARCEEGPARTDCPRSALRERLREPGTAGAWRAPPSPSLQGGQLHGTGGWKAGPTAGPCHDLMWATQTAAFPATPPRVRVRPCAGQQTVTWQTPAERNVPPSPLLRVPPGVPRSLCLLPDEWAEGWAPSWASRGGREARAGAPAAGTREPGLWCCPPSGLALRSRLLPWPALSPWPRETMPLTCSQCHQVLGVSQQDPTLPATPPLPL